MVLIRCAGPKEFTTTILAFSAKPLLEICDSTEAHQAAKQIFDIDKSEGLEWKNFQTELRNLTTMRAAATEWLCLYLDAWPINYIFREKKFFDGPFISLNY